VIASLSTAISLSFGIGIGRAFDGTILPLGIGMAALSCIGLPILYWVRRPHKGAEAVP
jgi:DHA1 family bicyclomycin/chloramphenicol resistance-like MFS transporter